MSATAERPVLFVTKFSLSPVTALGVQTALLMSAFPRAISLYWATPRHLPDRPWRVRLENALIARSGRLQGDRPAARLARAVGLSWWRSDSLRRSHRRRVERLRERVSAVYLAPIDAQDSARMRQLARVLRRPFVLHLWDSFSGPLLDDPHLRWLVQRAAHVFVVSESLGDDVRALGVPAETLLFTRRPSAVVAAAPAPGGSALRIALLGLLDPYADGVVLLAEAIAILTARGLTVEPVYVGSERGAALVNTRLSVPLVPTGFLSDDDRDAVLASCHLGFLPGPSADPAADMRSRYSVPSRSLDFLAIGLPAVGTVHPASATARFYAELGLDGPMSALDAPALAAVIEAQADPATWSDRHRSTREAWRVMSAEDPAQRLARSMDRLP